MSYGTIKVNTITFTNNGVDQSVTVSGIVASTSGNLTVTGTVSGSTASFANGIFNTFSGGTCTITSGVLASGTASNPAISFNGDVNTGIYSPNADEIGFTTNGQARFIIDANGQLEASSVGSASSPTYTFANDVDTGLYSPGTNQLALSAGGVERARIDSSGRLLIGTSTSRSSSLNADGNLFQIVGSQTLSRTSDDANAQYIEFVKGRAASAAVVGNDVLGRILFEGSDGTSPIIAAEIRALVDGTPGANDMPGRLVFLTTADGASSPTERMRITSGGNVGIGTTSPGDLLHVMESSASAVVASGASVAQFERAGNVGITLFTADTGDASIFFGDTASSTVGRVVYGHSDDSMRLWANSLERARIDSSGRLLVGTSTSRSMAGYGSSLQLEGATNYQSASASIIHNRADNGGPEFRFAKSRGTAQGSVNIVASGDILGRIMFYGADGSVMTQAANISVEVDGTPGVTDMPGRLMFSTTPDGAGSPVERMRITSGGNVGIGTSSPSTRLAIVGKSVDGVIAQFRPSLSDISDIARIELLGNNSTGTASQQVFFDAYQPSGGTGTDAALDIRVRKGGDSFNSPSTIMTLLGSGRVGIGTASPTSPLDVRTVNEGNRSNVLLIGNNGTTSGSAAAINIATGSDGTAGRTRGQIICDSDGNDNGYIAFVTRSSGSLPERARIDSSGRLLIGTSASVPVLVESGLQLHSVGANSWLNIGRWSNNSENAGFVFSKSRGAGVGTRAAVLSGDSLGAIYFSGDDGSSFVNAVQITAQADGTPGANDMPGRLVFSTTVDGASSPTEALRITNDRVIAYNQAAPVSKSTAATLTIEELKNGIIQYTGNAQTLTLPTGTSSEGGFSGLYNNMTFEWSVINTGSGTCTVAGNTGHTVVGAGAVAAGSSGRFASRRTVANTFVTYRLS